MKTNRGVIGVLMGGCSLEHEVSLRSGEGVKRALAASGYQVVSVTILKDGHWQIANEAPRPVFDALSQLRGLHIIMSFTLHGPNKKRAYSRLTGYHRLPLQDQAAAALWH